MALVIGAGVTVEHISLLGTQISVSRPGVVRLGLWLLWFYYLARYVQHWRDLRDHGPRDSHQLELQKRLIRVARREFEPKFMRQAGPLPAGTKAIFEYDQQLVRRDPFGYWVVTLGGSMTADVGERGHMSIIPSTDVRVEASRRDAALSWLAVGVKTRFFGEYGVPLVMACAPVLMTIVIALTP